MVDFEGQKLAEQIFYVVIIAFGGVGWVVGFLQQDFTIVFQAWLVGVILSVIVGSPPWRETKALLLVCDRFSSIHPSRPPLSIVDHSSVHQICVPDWPFYNKHPVKWLDSVQERRQHSTKAD
jgi:signal peptidase complex subunit 1